MMHGQKNIKFLTDVSVQLIIPTFRGQELRVVVTSVRNYHYSLRNNPEERSSLMQLVYRN
jgi:hypothetical protein